MRGVGESQCSLWFNQHLRNLFRNEGETHQNLVSSKIRTFRKAAVAAAKQPAPDIHKCVARGVRHTQFLWPSNSAAAWSRTCWRASSLVTPLAKVEASAWTWD